MKRNAFTTEPPCLLNFKLHVQQVKVESRDTDSLLQPLLMYSTLKNRVIYFTINVSVTYLSLAISHGWRRLRGIDNIYLVHGLQVTYLSCGLQVSHSRRKWIKTNPTKLNFMNREQVTGYRRLAPRIWNSEIPHNHHMRLLLQDARLFSSSLWKSAGALH